MALHTRALLCALPFLLLAQTGCPVPMPRTVPNDSPSEPTPGEPDPAAKGVLLGDTGARALLIPPAKITYDPRAIGASGAWVKIRLTNVGVVPLAVDRLRATFTANRDGVAFSGDRGTTEPSPAREPSTLKPGQSFDFERFLDCSMPLPGRYHVSSFVSLGDSATSYPAGGFSVDLVASGPPGPRPYGARDGLFILMTGAQVTRPLSAEAWARGDYHVVLAFINGSRRRIPVGPARVAFLVYKLGTPLPCSGQANTVSVPESLEPGAVHLARAPVACAPSEEGNYSIVGKLTLANATDEVEVGKVPLRVSGEPRIFAPGPWRPYLDVPATPR